MNGRHDHTTARSSTTTSLCLVLFTQKIRQAGRWINKHCQRSGTAVSCSWKRDLDKQSKNPLDNACKLMKDNPNVGDKGFSLELVKDIFLEVDGKDDPGK